MSMLTEKIFTSDAEEERDAYRSIVRGSSFGDLDIWKDIPEKTIGSIIKYTLPKYSYWSLFLDRSQADNVVLTETSLGQDSMVLSRFFENVIVVSPGAEESDYMNRLFSFHGRTNIRIIDLDAVGKERPGTFSNVVFHGIDEFFMNCEDPGKAKDGIDNIVERFSGKGAIYHSCSVVPSIFVSSAGKCGKDQLKYLVNSLIKPLGKGLTRTDIAFHPSLSLVSRIIPCGATSIPALDTHKWESLMKIYYRRFRDGKFTNGHGTIYHPPGKRENLFEKMLAICGEKVGGEKGLKITRIAEGNPVNAMVTIRSENSDGYIVRIPLNSYALERTRNANATLQFLWEKNIRMNSTLPRMWGEFDIYGENIFFENFFSGKCVEKRDRFDDSLYFKCIEWIIEFHKKTLTRRKFEENDFQYLVLKPTVTIEQAMSESEIRCLRVIQNHIYERLLGQEFPFVCMHGDFKLENMIVDRKFTRILGVIDWDLSMKESLPLLDVLNLVFFHSKTSRNITYEKAMLDLLNFDGIPRDEWNCIHRYMDDFQIERRLFKGLLSIFWIYYTTRRMNPYVWSVASWKERNFTRVAEFLSSEEYWK